MNSDAFAAYVTQVLVPCLRPGQLVILDNLSVHKRADIRQMIEAVGCHLIFLPAYSPDFNPIEQAFSKLKTCLVRPRRARRRPWRQRSRRPWRRSPPPTLAAGSGIVSTISTDKPYEECSNSSVSSFTPFLTHTMCRCQNQRCTFLRLWAYPMG